MNMQPLQRFLPDEILLKIAAESNLSETAFYLPRAQGDGYDLRWLTPKVEVILVLLPSAADSVSSGSG